MQRLWKSAMWEIPSHRAPSLLQHLLGPHTSPAFQKLLLLLELLSHPISLAEFGGAATPHGLSQEGFGG